MSEQEFLTGWYQRLCAEARRFDVTKPDVLCVHCGKPRKQHMDERERCTFYATTTHFLAQNREAVEMNEKTIPMLEALAVLRGWKLA